MKPTAVQPLKIGLLALLGLIFCSALVVAGHFYFQYQSLLKIQGKTEVDLLVETVSRLMVLPDEAPTAATVTDKTRLQDQPFFQSAENGDKVLIFQNAQKAILYRPSLRRIVDVAPVRSIEREATPAARILETKTKIPVVLLNGTETIGLTYKVEVVLLAKHKNLEIEDRKSAVRKNYEKTLVVDLTGQNRDSAQEIAQSLGAEVSDLPQDESAPAADFLIIVGRDQM